MKSTMVGILEGGGSNPYIFWCTLKRDDHWSPRPAPVPEPKRNGELASSTSSLIVWFLLALAALGVEMMIGSVYLLAVAAAAAFAGIAAKFGLSLSLQLAVCALFTVLGALLVRMRSCPKADASSKLMTLDAGQKVTVTAVAEDGTAVVQY